MKILEMDMQFLKENKKTCAICFSGQVRTAERDFVKTNIKNNIVKPFEDENYKIFYFGCSEKLYNNWIWNDFLVTEDKNYWGNDLELFNKNLGKGVTGGSFNVMNQWQKCKNVGVLKKQYEIKNNIEFDFVIRIRPDIVLGEPIIIKELSKEKYNIPNHDNWFGYNDRICIGNSKIMDYYMIEFVDNIKNYFQNENVIFHSETLLKHHIDKKNYGINRPSFKIYFERVHGTEYHNINFN
jgi:hypothetical protein